MPTQNNLNNQFPTNTPVASPLFYRSYSRPDNMGNYETWEQVIQRCIDGFQKVGNLTNQEVDRMHQAFLNHSVMPSGRWLWCGGTAWSDKPENVYGGYNCSATAIDSIETFGYLMNFAMQGCGTGASLEDKFTSKLPIIINSLNVSVDENPIINSTQKEYTEIRYSIQENKFTITVGDSRQGWVDSYMELLRLATFENQSSLSTEINVMIQTGNVRPGGKRLQGFGGVSNPAKLKFLYNKIADILNGAIGRKLNSEECCLILDEAALVVVAGNIRRSAGIRQFDSTASLLKTNLWVQDDSGRWKIDLKKDALRMSNHTRVFHKKPTLDECIDAVRSQYHSGEGAIQWTGEAIARGNADILDTPWKKRRFLKEYNKSQSEGLFYLTRVCPYSMDERELEHRINRYLLNPCGEIIFYNGFCNLSEIHLNTIDPLEFDKQKEAFTIGALSAATLLHQKFTIDNYQYSRDIDPIVGVSITGLFDFFVNLLGIDWLEWWEGGRLEFDKEFSENDLKLIDKLHDEHRNNPYSVNANEYSTKADFFRLVEEFYLDFWKTTVFNEVHSYCTWNNLKTPNRCTTVQPAGSKSLLTNASPGWHPPKAAYYIRRITYAKNDPGALACLDMGYSIVPSQSDKDDDGNLLSDPYHPNCTEWLVEIPVKTSWADLPGATDIDISKFSVDAQFDFYMQVQKHYTTHNTSATFEIREHEIESFGETLYDAIRDDEGYVSGAILARFDNLETFPRLPFEPISKETYENLVVAVKNAKVTDNFQSALEKHTTISGKLGDVAPSGCDSDACTLPEKK